ncbi:DUF3857 domain-containing protein [Hanamia caeni]|uniref:DUF3857 domain-containing protein n=1 Tax=Hanamia caeni TaxID=2294116 RepID=A0A3M9NAL9_9BACT|nr:DUF3857 domain-containing protein [Hanamia caeni]RNI34293.1 DUF3857 domain-containing protein [Hanamia caeni]
MKYNFIYVAALLLAGVTNVNAQTKDEARYRKQSEEIRKDVWGWNLPQFNVRNIPAEYSKASKVIIASRTELTAESKTKLAYYGLAFGTNKEQKLTEIVREMVKLNDKTAVDEYSQLSFTQFEKESGFYHPDKSTSYLGARVIKPDGKIEEIDADDIVLTQDESLEKKAKVAIPNLQPGDILDYFIATAQSLTNDNSIKPYQVILFSDAPVLNLSFHAQLGKKYGIQYRSYNGAPDMKVSKNDEDDIIADVVKTNIPPFETSLWVAAARQLPFIRMNISLGAGGANYFHDKIKPGSISKNSDPDDFIQGKVQELSTATYGVLIAKDGKKEYRHIENEAKRMAKQCNVEYKNLNDEEKAIWLFYTIRFTQLLNFDINQLSKTIHIGNYSFNHVAFPIYATFKSAGLEPGVLISSDRTGFRLKEILSKDDLLLTTFIPGSQKFFSFQSVYDLPLSTPSDIEGLKDVRSFIYNPRSKPKADNGQEVKASTSDKNAHIENLQLSLTPDKNNLTVHRSTTLKGFYKMDAQRALILYEDYYEEERKSFHEEKSLIESLEDGKRSAKSVDEVKNAFKEARNKQKDQFVSEAKEWFNQDVSDLKDYKTDTLGVRISAPNFVYSSSFNLNGLVKKAGNNIIVEIGKIEGEPLIIKPEQRKRDIDMYAPFARSIEYNIEFQIPDGYTVQGIEALNKNVTNETGFFIAEATTSGKTVTIKVKKHYLHNYEPSKNWDKLIEFTDAAGDWANSKLLLKKS